MSRNANHLIPSPQFFGTAGFPVPRGGVYVWPWGDDNHYPQTVREVFLENGTVQNGLKAKVELLWGAGAALYTSRFEGGRRRQQWVRHDGIERWLSTWNWKGYLEAVSSEFTLLNGFFTKWVCDNTPFKDPAIIRLEHVPCGQARFVWRGEEIEPSEVCIGDYSRSAMFGYSQLPLFDPARIRFDKEMVGFDKLPQALVDDYYPRSAIHGSLSWIRAGAGTAVALTAQNTNSMEIKYHIEVPALYWDKQRKMLSEQCVKRGEPYFESMLERLKDETFVEIDAALSGTGNAGKFIATEKMFDEISRKYVGWKITTLEHPGTRDFTGAQIKIGKEASYNVAAGMGIHPELSGITKTGGLSGGSELEYAAKIFRAVTTDIAEKIIFSALNQAISINFDNPGIRMGFDRESI